MNLLARILSELKIPLARIPFRDWPAAILFWMQFRRLFETLDTMFTAWKSGALPPPPVATAPVPTAAPSSPSIAQPHAKPPAVAPQRARMPVRRTPRAPKAPRITPRAPMSGRAAAAWPAPPRQVRAAPGRVPQPDPKFATFWPSGESCVQLIAISK